MRKRFRVMVAVSLAAVLGVFSWQVLVSRGPSYKGRNLTAWLDQYAESRTADAGTNSKVLADQAEIAIRQTGTKGIPFLLEMVRSNDGILKSNLIVFARKQKLVPIHPYTDQEFHHLAVFGFYALGSTGKQAVPALIDSLKDTNPDIRLTAADCLGNIGPAAKDAVPVLIQFLTDTNRLVRWDTMVNLGRIHAEPGLVVPLLVNAIGASNIITDRLTATVITTIGQFGEEAKEAIPTIIRHLNDEDITVRNASTNALKAIDLEAADKAGVK
jgi:hypothetical protein